jgi:hypothetical protein
MKGTKASVDGLKLINQAFLDSINKSKSPDQQILSSKSPNFRKAALDYLDMNLPNGLSICKARLGDFFNGKSILREKFQAICEVIGIHNWSTVAEIGTIELISQENLFGRTEQLIHLEKLVGQPSCRLIYLEGNPGIGKKSLIRQFIDKSSYAPPNIWATFNYACPVDSLLKSLNFELESKGYANKQKIPTHYGERDTLWRYLYQNRLLIILEDARLTAGLENSTIKDEYRQLFIFLSSKNGYDSHKSCIIVITDDRLAHTRTESDKDLCRSMELPDLASDNRKELIRKILEHASNEDINRLANMSGNPGWLEYTARYIQEYFSGNVESYLDAQEEEICVPGKIDRSTSRILDYVSENCWIILRILIDADWMSYRSIEESFLEQEPKRVKFVTAWGNLKRCGFLRPVDEDEAEFEIVNILKPIIRRHHKFNLS